MIIVISPEDNVKDEIAWVNQLFDEGLALYHIRKPLFLGLDLIHYITAIDEQYWSRVVVHQYFDVAADLGINRFHLKEKDRLKHTFKGADNVTLSMSTHQIKEFNQLDAQFEYAFLSPFFESISKKGYGHGSTLLQDINLRENEHTKLIALGGINEENINQVYPNVDGVALLGTIWQSDNPLKTYKQCIKKIALLP